MINGYFLTPLTFCFIKYVPSFTVRWSGIAIVVASVSCALSGTYTLYVP
jgi:hypothetical protein